MVLQQIRVMSTPPCVHAGSGDVVSVGCVYIGDSSLQEISQFTTSSDSSDEDRSNQRGVDPVISAIDYDLYMEQLEEASVAFDVVNPHSPAYKTVVIRNYRYVLCTCMM